MRMAILFLLLAAAAHANELPETPLAKPVEKQHTRPFWDRPAKIEFGIGWTVAAFDTAQTCHNLAQGGHEYKLPISTCTGDVAFTAMEQGAAWGLSYLLHRMHHDKLARIPEAYLIGANTYGIAYSHAHGAF